MNVSGDHYQVLGVSADANGDALRLAYRDLMRRIHPDVNDSDEAAARARAANEAYRILADPKSRARYDQDRLRKRGLSTLSPSVERPADRQQIQQILEQEFHPRQSWAPFLAFVLTSATVVGLLVASGRLDPTAQKVADIKLPPAGSAEKQTNDLVAKIAIADLRPSGTQTTQKDDAPASDIGVGETGKGSAGKEQLTPILSDLAVGAGTFAQISLKSGLIGARQFSEQCHLRAVTSRSIREADRCTAFDFTGSYVDAEASLATLNPPNAYFEARGRQSGQIYRSVGLSSEAASVRLAAVKRLTLPMIAGAG